MTHRTSFRLATLATAALAIGPIAARAAANGEIVGIVELGSGSRVSNAVVSLVDVSGTFHPSGPVDMNQLDKEFVPRVIAVLKGTTVRFVSSDPFFHNVFSSSRLKTFNVSQETKGDVSEVVFDKAGIVPIRCHIHGNMKGYVVVLSNPFFGVTNARGLFRITGVPAGSYTIKVWGEKFAAETKTVDVPSSGQAKVLFKIAH